MNQLQVKTIELTPAVVEFNFDELSEVLDQQLSKYEGLEFTEKDAASCKKTITELNKGKKALNDYRLKTKKELTVSVTEFENKCKELAAKFDSVINPLKEQQDEFEENRKAIKRLEIEGFIDHLVHVEGLNEKYAARLMILESHLNKSKSLKSIREDLTVKAEHLGIAQDKFEADQEVIKSHVQLINAKENLNLPESPFLSLLDHKEVADIKAQIETAAKVDLEKDEPKFEQVPLSSAPASVSKDDEMFVERYWVAATESQLEALEEFMNQENIEWKVIEE
ncbi:DUF1351 domain-containing protein [Oceanobacillus profundus]|uniref:DUF1351 domain-containing protein n=1 Tax=Oceanobacillus TaxID=182709 RepID=UPI0026E15799|nr:DUF1351 domain-containing protein [Oceanobacillus profundus]MDO6448117.1 DUF1351 domain-containing protein [Oceanobacillus profundus]